MTTPENNSLSIVLPAYNEEEIIARTVRDLDREVLRHFNDGELIVVDDCSHDATLTILKDLEAEIPRLKVLHNRKNLGHGPSLLRGLKSARYDLVFALDSDYQHPPADFWKLYPLIDQAAIVTGLRKPRHDPRYRRLLSFCTNLLARRLFSCPLADLNIPFKLFRAATLDTILEEIPESCRIPSILIMLTACKMQVTVEQVPVRHLPRSTGECSLPGRRLILFAAASLKELLNFHRSQHHRPDSE